MPAARARRAANEERLLRYDIRELIALHHRLETAQQRNDRRLVRALSRLVVSPTGQQQRIAGQ